MGWASRAPASAPLSAARRTSNAWAPRQGRAASCTQTQSSGAARFARAESPAATDSARLAPLGKDLKAGNTGFQRRREGIDVAVLGGHHQNDGLRLKRC